MQQLLENEGIVVIENQIQDLETVFWNPGEKSPNFSNIYK
jgi:methylated-DNA-protein-cysteine methyltransferase-like protein